MPRHSAASTKRSILDSAYGLFYRRGFARVGVDEIAALAKVTKRTLYYHFKSKDQLLESVLELQLELALARVRKHEKHYSGSAIRFVSVLFSELKRWSAKPLWSGSGMTRIVMELADLPGHPARAVARRHKEHVQAWYMDMLRKAGVPSPKQRAKELHLLVEGANALILISGDQGYADAAARAAKRLIANPDL
jgi:AcrR family transcriptional regulator